MYGSKENIMIVFVIAMQKEIAPILDKAEISYDEIMCDKRVIKGKLFNKDFGAVICGVGKVNAACGAQYAIDIMGADCIVNLGVAGGLNNGLEIAGVYAVSHSVQYDFDLTQLNGTEIGTLDEFKENYLPLTVNSRYPAKRVATGDRFNDSPADYELLTKTLKADIRDMECAAIAQTCAHAGVKFRAYKIISDLAGSGSTTEQYLKNLEKCAHTLENELENLVKEIYL